MLVTARRRRRALVLAALLAPAAPALRPESSLATECYGFPAVSFSEQNCVKAAYGKSPHVPLAAGETATDFTLETLNGVRIKLSELLDEAPVVLVWGMWTCPAFQGLGDGGGGQFDECGYLHEYALVERYADRVHFIHLVGPEPHPATPFVNFDSGKQLPNYWSTVDQPWSWASRKALAAKVASYTHPAAVLLVDELADAPGGRVQPVWCTLGQGARTALLIGRDGSVVHTQDWFHATAMGDALDAHLASFVDSDG
mmetsp:Transcript_35109/g.108771  ORF Transcript_35109/g.108771 Transcript_35109/m.108771 type:complete len:256 (-) Transcript_35109:18-785(-)